MPPNNDLEKKLWAAADQLRANSSLTAQEYSRPVLGLIFLKYADHRFSGLEKKFTEIDKSGRRTIDKTDYQAEGVMYLPPRARYSYLINLPEGADIGKKINEAMEAIEKDNEDLQGVLPRTYNSFDSSLLIEMLKIFNGIPLDTGGDAKVKIDIAQILDQLPEIYSRNIYQQKCNDIYEYVYDKKN